MTVENIIQLSHMCSITTPTKAPLYTSRHSPFRSHGDNQHSQGEAPRFQPSHR